LLVHDPQPAAGVVEMGRRAKGLVNRRVVTFRGDVIGEDGHILFPGKAPLRSTNGTPALRDLAFPPELIALKDATG